MMKRATKAQNMDNNAAPLEARKAVHRTKRVVVVYTARQFDEQLSIQPHDQRKVECLILF